MNESVKVAVILPSRGLIFSRTAEEVLNNLKGIPHKICFSHQKPIPECFELPTVKALEDPDITHLWFVEDDMALPPHILKDMLDVDKAVVTVNYPTTAKGDSSVLTVKGRIIYAGTGCTLVKRAVFDELKAPYFRTDIMWQPKNRGDHILFRAVERGEREGYGLHDVTFFIRLYLLEIPVHKLNYTIGQRKLRALGKAGTNDGAHKIDMWHKVKKDRYFTLVKNAPVEKIPGLVEILTPTGYLLAKPDHAKKLIKNGLAEKAPKRAVVIDDGGLL